jgi:hypothetical protein
MRLSLDLCEVKVVVILDRLSDAHLPLLNRPLETPSATIFSHSALPALTDQHILVHTSDQLKLIGSSIMNEQLRDRVKERYAGQPGLSWGELGRLRVADRRASEVSTRRPSGWTGLGAATRPRILRGCPRRRVRRPWGAAAIPQWRLQLRRRSCWRAHSSGVGSRPGGRCEH